MKYPHIIIITILATLMASMLFLAYVEKNQRDTDEDFWSVYFVYPLADNNTFVIDNRSSAATFHYDITTESGIIASDDVEIETKDRILIKTEAEQNAQPVTITVKKGDEKKELEKK